MNTIGQNISVERLKRRLTQEKLAAELGITQSLLSDIENDKVSPKWDLITDIADKLQVSVNDILPSGNMNNPILKTTQSELLIIMEILLRLKSMKN